MRTRPAVPVLDLTTTDAYSDWLRPIIWRLLDQHDVTQNALAAHLSVSPKHLNQLLRGHIRISPEIGARILAQFGWQVTYGLTPLLTATKETP